MFCTVSREACVHPVISKKTGHIFEKELIEKHLTTTGKCPITEEDMSVDDLVEVKGYQPPTRPRLPTASSVPAILKTLQNEWDQIMLDSYKLKKHVESTRQQLSHALYQYDAACRVIARLTQERDRALQELANTRENMAAAMAKAKATEAETLKSAASNATPAENGAVTSVASKDDSDTEMADAESKSNDDKDKASSAKEEDSDAESDLMGDDLPSNVRDTETISSELVEYITQTAAKLAQVRKERKKKKKKGGSQMVEASVLKSYSVQETHTLHSPNEPGITCMDLHPSQNMQKYIVTGGTDSTIIIFNRESRTIDHVLRGHRRRITSLQFHPKRPIMLSSSSDKTSVIWRYSPDQEKWNKEKTFETQKKCVTAVSLHPTNSYFATSSLDSTWCFHSFTGATLCQVENEAPLTGLQIHPDGQLLTTLGEDRVVKIWDLRTQKAEAQFSGHKGTPQCLDFSQNGYNMATGDDKGEVKFWDLRRLRDLKGEVKVWDLRKIDIAKTLGDFGGNRIHAVRFDPSAKYLAVGQPYGMEILDTKRFDRIASFRKHSKDVTSIRFGINDEFIATASRDRTVKIYSDA